jgi:hypothetical protein
MERHEILEAMGELKLYGMRASFDEVEGQGPHPARRALPAHRQPHSRRAHPPTGALDQLSHR